ncbi:hypothetical protein R6Q59_025090 [Mikania micrantha]
MDNPTDTNRHHGSTTNNRSMSDTDSTEYNTPERFPLQSNEFHSSPSKAIVAVENYYTSFRSQTSNHQNPPETLNFQPPLMAYNRSARDEPVTGVAKVNAGGGEEGNGGAGGERRSRRLKRDVLVNRSVLGFRVLEVILSLIAFSVMASDKTQGWSGDSFDRYKEYRYVVAVNAVGFAYAAFQAVDMTYHLFNGNHIISYSIRPVFDFLMDQILAYLLISASSSAATRVDDWVSNWGKDDFTEMATASIGMSFLAFFAFALSALISGYNLCNQKSI